MKKISQSGSTQMGLVGTLLPRLPASLAWLGKTITFCVLDEIRSSTVKRKSQPYYVNLNKAILVYVLRHEQAGMQEYYKPGRTRPCVLKRLAKLQRYQRIARRGHSRPN